MNKLIPYLQLVRIPGVFTAQADILAGFLIVGGGLNLLPHLVLLIASSSFFYSAGMALNDFFDISTDKKERPERPIPSGRVKKEVAFAIGISFLIIGLFIASIVGTPSFIVSLLLVILILSYNMKLKKYPWIGPINLGGCRYLNLLLGFSVLPLTAGSFLIPLLTGIYIFGVSVLARRETDEKLNPFPVIITILCIAVVFLLYWIYSSLNMLPLKTGFIFCGVWAFISSGYLLFKLYRKNPDKRQNPVQIQKTVKLLLLSIVILDALIVIGIRPFIYSFIILVLLVPGALLSKKMYVT